MTQAAPFRFSPMPTRAAAEEARAVRIAATRARWAHEDAAKAERNAAAFARLQAQLAKPLCLHNDAEHLTSTPRGLHTCRCRTCGTTFQYDSGD